MSAKGLYGVVVARQFRLGQCGVNFAMADVMQKNRRTAFPAFELGDQMVETLRCVRRNRPVTKGADRIGHLMAECDAWITKGKVQTQ